MWKLHACRINSDEWRAREGSRDDGRTRQEVRIMFNRFQWNGGAAGGSAIAIMEEPAPCARIERIAGPTLRVKVASTGFYAPPRIETAADLAPRIGRSEEWILARTGVAERRIAEEPLEIMAAHAARAALQSGGTPDLIINASTTPRQLIPDNSVFIQRELGFEGIPSFSVNATCLSFVVALHNAAALIASGAYRRVLVVSAEAGSFARNMSQPESAALIGDGAAAALLEPTPDDEGSELVGWRMQTWPVGAELTEVRGGGQRRYPNHAETRPDDHLFSMDGPGVYRMARPRVASVVRELLADLGLAIGDIDWLVPHQASGPGLELLPRLGFAIDRIVNIVGKYGNCIAASVPMALATLAASGRLRRGDTVLVLGTGAGLSVAGAVLRW
jgi:3-oxoacyl-[acyl-carrier-protein] synthase III